MVFLSVGDAEGDGHNLRGDPVRPQVEGVDTTVAIGVRDDCWGVVVNPVLVLVGGNGDPKHRADVPAEERGCDDPGIPDLVRSLVREARQVEEVGQVLGIPGTTVLVERSTISPPAPSGPLRVSRAGERGLTPVGCRSGQLELAPLQARLGYCVARS